MLQPFEKKLLDGWEDVYKRAQLTLWILLALKAGPKHMATIKEFVLQETNGLLEADDKSMYRALRRFNDVEMVTYKIEKNKNGPDRKKYHITDTGLEVLNAFAKRNVLAVFFKPSVKRLLES